MFCMKRVVTFWIVVVSCLFLISGEPAWGQDAGTGGAGESSGTPTTDDPNALNGEGGAAGAKDEEPDAPVKLPSVFQDILDQLPEGSAFSLTYRQWIGLFALILVGLALDMLVRLWLRVILQRLTRRAGAETDKPQAARVVRPLGLVAAALFWLWLLPSLQLEGAAESILSVAVRLISVLACVWAGWGVVDSISTVLMAKAAKTETKVDDVLVPLFRKTVKVFIVVLGVIYGAAAMNVEIAPLLAGLGIGGLAFGLAAKDTIENFFGSVAVVLDRPFHVGDWVVIGETEGIVEEIGFRSTRVRTFYNSLMSVPNATLVRAVVDNYGSRRYRRWKTYVGVQYDTPPDRIIAFTEGIRELVRHHPYSRKDYFQVYLNDFADSSLNILLYVFFEVPDWSTELRERERLFIDIVRLADQLEVNFAFPTQTIHLFQEDKHAMHTPGRLPQAQTDASAQEVGVTAAHRIIAQQPWRAGRPGAVEFPDGKPIDDTDEDHPPIEDRSSGG
ncbi:MAG: mechanosensitive ion channel protein MscS [Planctomycetaceae bacterium]|nr:mechanosensitive ion channel protein MscS [Planctomycetaceae bacterium]